MKFEIYGEHINITDAMRDKIEKKLSFLSKYILIQEDTVARVVVKIYPKNLQKVEVTIPTKVGLLRGEVLHEDFYAGLDLVIDKLEDQIRRQKTRLNRRFKDSLSDSFYEELNSEKEVAVRTKRIIAESMDLDQAILEMEMLGHSFYIYHDIDTDTNCVCYKRNDGGYALIEIV